MYRRSSVQVTWWTSVKKETNLLYYQSRYSHDQINHYQLHDLRLLLWCDNYTHLGIYTPQNGSLLVMLQDFLDSLTHADWINKLSHNASNKLPFYAMQNPRIMQIPSTINWLQTTQHHTAFTYMCKVYIVYTTDRRTEIKNIKKWHAEMCDLHEKGKVMQQGARKLDKEAQVN